MFQDNQCTGDTTTTDPSFEDRRWFTPRPKEAAWQASFGDAGTLAAHAHVVYASGRRAANVTVIATHRVPGTPLQYVFGKSPPQASPSHSFAADGAKAGMATPTLAPLEVSVIAADGSRVELEPIDFAWTAPAIAPRAADFRGGQKGAIVEMFGWPHADVEQECAFLAEHGYMGVKVYPSQEQVMSSQPFDNTLNPWYFMYQPVSYKLAGRMGSRDALRSMVHAMFCTSG